MQENFAFLKIDLCIIQPKKTRTTKKTKQNKVDENYLSHLTQMAIYSSGTHCYMLQTRSVSIFLSQYNIYKASQKTHQAS